MPDVLIPDPIKQFILQYIDSIAQLEGLLLLRGNSNEAWTVSAIARGLYIDDKEARQLLAHLAEKEFVRTVTGAPVESYQYDPRSEDMCNTINQLAEFYRRCLVPITNLVHSKSRNKIQEFANAFKIRKE